MGAFIYLSFPCGYWVHVRGGSSISFGLTAGNVLKDNLWTNPRIIMAKGSCRCKVRELDHLNKASCWPFRFSTIHSETAYNLLSSESTCHTDVPLSCMTACSTGRLKALHQNISSRIGSSMLLSVLKTDPNLICHSGSVVDQTDSGQPIMELITGRPPGWEDAHHHAQPYCFFFNFLSCFAFAKMRKITELIVNSCKHFPVLKTLSWRTY